MPAREQDQREVGAIARLPNREKPVHIPTQRMVRTQVSVVCVENMHHSRTQGRDPRV